MSDEKVVKKSSEGVILIGGKPFMNYVTAAVMQINNGTDKVLIKARGKHISRAVDVAEVIRNRFVSDLKVSGIEIGSEDVTNREGKDLKVSTIEIALIKWLLVLSNYCKFFVLS